MTANPLMSGSFQTHATQMTRRYFFGRESGCGHGGAGHTIGRRSAGAGAATSEGETPRLDGFHHPPRAKRVISLFMSGGPSQMELFDYKPLLNQLHGQELPAEVRRGQRLTGMSGNQATLPLAGSLFGFAAARRVRCVGQ